MPNGPYEDRPNWAALFRRKKAESWMSDYSGVVVLAEQPGGRWWVNVWRNRTKSQAKFFSRWLLKRKPTRRQSRISATCATSAAGIITAGNCCWATPCTKYAFLGRLRETVQFTCNASLS